MVGTVAVDGHNTTAGVATATVRTRRLGLALAVENEVPHGTIRRVVVNGTDEANSRSQEPDSRGIMQPGPHVVHIPLDQPSQQAKFHASSAQNTNLDVAPPVAVERARAFGEVDVLVRVRVVERLLVADTALVAVERNAVKGASGVLHLHITHQYNPMPRQFMRQRRARTHTNCTGYSPASFQLWSYPIMRTSEKPLSFRRVRSWRPTWPSQYASMRLLG